MWIPRCDLRVLRVLILAGLCGCSLMQLPSAMMIQPTAPSPGITQPTAARLLPSVPAAKSLPSLAHVALPAALQAVSPPPAPAFTAVSAPSQQELPTPTPTPQAGTFVQSPAPSGPIDLAAASNGGRIVSVTDEDPDFPAINLIDGVRYETLWSTNGPARFPQTVVFALANDEVKTIDRVVLNPWSSDWRHAWVKDFDIYVSDTSPQLDQMTRVGSFTLDYVGIDQTFTFDPTPAKYVALVVNSNQGSDVGTLLNEFEVYEAQAGVVPVKTGNLAAAANGGHIVAFSSQDPNGKWGPDHLIDSQNDTPEGWSSEDLTTPQYVEFAFKDDIPRVINRVVLNPYSDGYQQDWIKDFELRASDSLPDLASMQSLGHFTLQQVGQDQEFTFAPTSVRYLALVPLSNYGGTAFALNEFEAYAAPTVAEHLDKSQPAPGTTGQVTVPQYPAGIEVTQSNAASHQTGATLDNIEFSEDGAGIVPSEYHLYGTFFESLVNSTLTNHNTFPVTVRVQADVPHYTDVAIETVTLAPGETQTVEQNPPLLPGVLEQLDEAKDAQLHMRVDYLQEGEPRLIYEGTEPLTVWARGDVGLGVPGFYNPFLFEATLVTPNDPVLADVLRAAADYEPGGIIPGGYGDDTDSNRQVYNEMKSIYQAVADRGVIYVDTGIPFVLPSLQQQGFYLQRLKLPYEVLQTRSGMCIETSLLFASLYEKIELDPVIIRIPGHAYLAVPISPGSTTYYVLETTMVGRASFGDALAEGAAEFNRDLANLSKDQLDLYYWLDVSQVRQEGILPIPWR